MKYDMQVNKEIGGFLSLLIFLVCFGLFHAPKMHFMFCYNNSDYLNINTCYENVKPDLNYRSVLFHNTRCGQK